MQIEYFHRNPDEIDEVTAPLNIHLMYLLVGVLIGVSFIVIAKVLSFSGILSSLGPMMVELIVDLTFETGTAFVGAGATALVLGVLLNAQQKNAETWKTQIRKSIRDRYG